MLDRQRDDTGHGVAESCAATSGGFPVHHQVTEDKTRTKAPRTKAQSPKTRTPPKQSGPTLMGGGINSGFISIQLNVFLGVLYYM